MKFLLTNDDGIDAPGLEALEDAVRQFGELVVVAPLQAWSGCSHQTTTHRPLPVTRRTSHRFAVDGTPADCIRLGILYLAPDADWVLAGINDGANLGVDVHMSGTVAAAREAALLGKNAVAFSHYRIQTIDWEIASQRAAFVFRRLSGKPLARRAYWNVNFPDQGAGELPKLAFCSLDPHPLPIRFEPRENGYHYCGDYHQRTRERGRDVDVCFAGSISVSQIALD